MFAAWCGANWGASSMMTLPAASSRYRVFCGSSGRQSVAVELASTSAEVRGRCADSVVDPAGGGGGAAAAGARAGLLPGGGGGGGRGGRGGGRGGRGRRRARRHLRPAVWPAPPRLV